MNRLDEKIGIWLFVAIEHFETKRAETLEMILGFLFSSVFYAFVAFFLYLVYNYRKNYTYWTKSGLPYIPFPRDCVFFPRHKALTLQTFYNELAPHPLGGFYKMSRPFLMIRDPKLIRLMTIKDFAHFTDRGLDVHEELDPLNLHIFRLEGSRWKTVRGKITPAFSSARVKAMWPYLEQCERMFEKYLDHHNETNGQIDVMEAFEKFTVDVIGTCVLGLECSAIQSEDSALRKTAHLILRPSNLHFLRSFLRSTGLKFISWLKWKKVFPAVDDFFFSIVRETIKHRAENEARRQDFMQHLINIQQEELETLRKQENGQEPVLTEAMIAAQAFLFFVAGYESTAGTLAYCLHLLAQYPEMVEKCRLEVEEVVKQNGGTLTYECLNDLTYLQSVIDETLRLYPPLGWLERICVIPYVVPDSSYIIKKGQRIIIPIHAIHHNPQYFPEPEKFDPDRFSKTNKSNIISGTYFPFGDGPRICAGMRFAFMVMKATLASLLMSYDIEPSSKTKFSVEFERTMFLLVPKNGLWLKIKKRAVEEKSEDFKQKAL